MIDNKQYKRQCREMPQYVKDKIAATMRGRKLSAETKKRISDGQRKAWAQIPHQKDVTDLWPTSNDNNNENEQNTNGTEKESKF